MIESIMIGLGFFALGALISLILTSIASHDEITEEDLGCRVLKYNIDNGKQIHVWRGFVFPEHIHMCTSDENGNLVGDEVVFDENGNIIFVDKNEK
jgi:hypothetical protein